MGNCDLKDGEGEGEIKRFIIVIDGECDGGESEGETRRLVLVMIDCEGETRRLVLVMIDCEGGRRESEGKRLAIGCCEIDETEEGKKEMLYRGLFWLIIYTLMVIYTM